MHEVNPSEKISNQDLRHGTERLAGNVRRLRQGIGDSGFTLLGQPSPIVPVVLGEVAKARRMTAHAIEHGALVNLVEFPAVSRNSSRWRLQVMADHEAWHIDRLVEVVRDWAG